MNAVCNFEELLLTPSYDLQFLWLNLCLPETSYLDFVNGLLLICHPKTLSIFSKRNSSEHFVKVYINFFLYFSFEKPSLAKIDPFLLSFHRHGLGLLS